MSLQDIISRNQNAAAVAAIVVILIAGYAILRSAGVVAPPQPSAYYYDLQTGQTSAAPTGTEGIVAHIYACNDCSDTSDRFIAYIETVTDEARAELAKSEPNLQIITDGHLVALPDTDPQWVPINSPAGADIANKPYNKCEAPQQCLP